MLMLTAKNQSEDIIAGFEAGANDYLTKPVNKPELIIRLETLIKLRTAVKDVLKSRVINAIEQQKREIAEDIKDYMENLNKNFNYGKIIELMLDVVGKNINFNKIIVLTREKKSYKITSMRFKELKNQSKIKINENDVSLIERYEDLNEGYVKIKHKFSWNTTDNIENIMIEIYNNDLKKFILIEINKNDKIDEESMELILNYIRQGSIVLTNVKLFYDLHNTLYMLTSIEKITSLISAERDENKLIDYVMAIVRKSTSNNYKKIMYFKYYEDTKTMMLEKMHEGIIDENIFKSKENILEDLEEIVKKDSIKPPYVRIELIEGEISKVGDVDKKIHKNNFENNVYFEYENKDFIKIINMKKAGIFPIYDDKSLYGMLVIDIEDDIKENDKILIHILTLNIGAYFSRKKMEIEKIKNEKSKDFRCKSCNAKLSEYKGTLDYIEIKCPRCNEMNVIKK